ncbi:MAG: VOC family protein [Mesorhizobium sp.]
MDHLIRQMGYVVLSTPDPDESARDLSEIVGLKVTERHDSSIYMSANDRRCEVVWQKGDSPGVVVIGLEAMDAASVDEVARRAQADGLVLLSDRPTVEGVERAIRFATPFGPVFEVHTPVQRNQPPRHIGTGARPRRLEHVNVRVSDTSGFRDFALGTLGMKLSDRTANNELAWYRAWDGYHHTLAVGAGNCLHHYAFDAYAMEDLIHIADSLVIKKRHLLWGPGRHGAGENIFTYYRDPNGCAVETSVGLARIDNDLLYEARVWSLDPDSGMRNLWERSPPPEAFTTAGIPYLQAT